MKIKERYAFLDLIKSIAIFFVLFYHNFFANTDILNSNSIVTYFNYFIKSILSCCVPLFFFANGALLLNKELNIKKHIKKILIITAITLTWAILTLILLMFIYNDFLTFKEFIIAITTWKLGWINHLWFLQAIVVIYIFLPIIKNAYDTNKSHFYFFFITVMILTFGNVLLSICANIGEFIIHVNFFEGNYNFFSGFNAFRGIYGYSLGYFMLGGLWLTIKEKLVSKRFTIVCFTAIFVSMFFLTAYGTIMSISNNKMFDVVWNGYDTIFTLLNVIAISTISLVYKGNGIIGRFVTIIGQNTLGIYFLHVPIGKFLRPFFSSLSVSSNILINAFYAFILLLLSLGMSLILKKIPIVKSLFSI